MLADQAHSPLLSVYPMGDSAIVAEFGHTIQDEVHARVMAFACYLEEHPFKGMIEYVPAFTTVTVYYDPWIVGEAGKTDAFEKLKKLILYYQPAAEKAIYPSGRLLEIPVCYGGSFGPDLEFVASYTGFTQQEVIALHTENTYLVYMIGFAPGFPYLGGMNPSIATPRKDSPRSAIPAGSIGIAGTQTGVYPLSTPGGWQLIGRTPIPLFDFAREQPSLLKAGDKVRFVAVTQQEYELGRKGLQS